MKKLLMMLFTFAVGFSLVMPVIAQESPTESKTEKTTKAKKKTTKVKKTTKTKAEKTTTTPGPTQ
jgi:hypothetical protein